MHLSLLASLDLHCRQRGAELLSGTHPGSVVVVHDLLDGATVLRRIYRDGELNERASSQLEHGCLSCTVRLEILPTVRRLIRENVPHVVLALPPGVELDMVIEALYAGVEEEFSIDNAVLVVDPAELEDQLWDRRSLSEIGMTSYPKDRRTSDEFVVGTVAQADTVLAAASLANSLSEPGHLNRALGFELLRELAPHANVARRTAQVRPGCFDLSEAMARQTPGEVRVASGADDGVFRTIRHELSRPLHPERLRSALPELAAGSCWIRGRLWLASVPGQRIAMRGIGPRLWLENTGEWLSGLEQPGTVVALTGRANELIESEIHELLNDAQLSAAEAHQSAEYFSDPFGLDVSN
ncbi:nitrile hydratase subunit beta [Renibacterium salmoninarum ATCC 33209]|uniref:Nitrile hydratase subunit beta n=1 Tax=Renibacterium salmoninarum (strain ATCC 33209 / DSM 20767 / JCM 11484 / NBRC 15589 / NCIMB 2235) TaxID=288705 RepID=A9WMV5_RENSM|nr:GTP-binding protein [Renibacterium salmoninarum]ABY23416.1 nitrile hydratase subunit beta [Renibacterium salmoninarum ATCC 33209]